VARAAASQDSGLLDRLISDRADERQQAITEALQLEPATRDRTIERLVARFSSKGLESYFAALSLGAFGEPAVAPLISAIQSPNSQERYGASEVLGRIGVPALKPLIDVLGNRSQDVRCAAAHALAVIGPGATVATPKLIRLLSTNSPDLTRCVLDALGHIGSPEALRALSAELKVEAFQGKH